MRVLTTATPLCTREADVFQHPLLEEPASSTTLTERRQAAALEIEARAICGRCPLAARCLYTAVVEHDVAGFVAGTTARQRQAIRARLGVRVDPEDLDSLAGVSGRNRPVDHQEVLRLRRQNPDESLETIAQRLGCSLSTVKRHLRKARNGEDIPVRTRPRPSLDEVLSAHAAVERPSTRRAA